MTATVLSRREIERIERFDRKVAVISVTDPRSAPARLPKDRRATLRLSFWDCDPEALRRNFDHWVKHEAEEWNVEPTRVFVEKQIAEAMNEEHAAAVRDFVRGHARLDLVVHCEAGISRSAGIVAGLCASDPSIRWGNESRGGYRPNAHVKSLVMAAMRSPVAPERHAGGEAH